MKRLLIITLLLVVSLCVTADARPPTKEQYQLIEWATPGYVDSADCKRSVCHVSISTNRLICKVIVRLYRRPRFGSVTVWKCVNKPDESSTIIIPIGDPEVVHAT